ncbi:type IV fimbrial biogenesis PilY1-related protein, partial [mine drainage metagenome]
TNDLDSTQIQSLYGLYDAMPNGSVITRSQLVQQTITATTITTVSGNTVNARSVTSNQLDLPTKMGWYIDFSLSPGEAVVTEPALVDGALFVTTDQPSGISCEGGFNSWLYAFNYRDGGLFPYPFSMRPTAERYPRPSRMWQACLSETCMRRGRAQP